METKYLDKLIDSVDNIDTCEMLQEVYEDVFTFIREQLESLQGQADSFGVLQKLLEVPQSIDDVLSWVTDFIQEYLAKVLSPLVKIQADIMMLTAKLIEIQSKITEKMKSIPLCSFSLTSE